MHWKYNPQLVREMSQGKICVSMVLGGISVGGRMDPHMIQNGALTAQKYADVILRPYVIIITRTIGGFFFTA